jgi:hypothetical protein
VAAVCSFDVTLAMWVNVCETIADTELLSF